MPGKTQGVITISKGLDDRLNEIYNRKRVELFSKHDIRSKTAYAQRLLERGLLQDDIQGYYEIVDQLDDVVHVKDYRKRERIIAVEIRSGKVFCELDQTGNCDHVGYILANPYIIQKAKEKGLKLSRANA
jgi:hypothetical protein